MRNLKTIITFIYLSLIFSVEVEEFYILYDKNNMNQNLYRPKISKDNTYISAEIHTFMSDIKDGYNNVKAKVIKVHYTGKYDIKLQNNSDPVSVTLIDSDDSTPQSPNCITAII